MSERAYLHSFAELVDRLQIVNLKIIYADETLKGEFLKEAADIKHDIDIFISEGVSVDSEMVQAIGLLQAVHWEIWHNESAGRGDGDKADYDRTHKLNSDRAHIKKRIQQLCGGRIDHKLNYINGLLNFPFNQ